MPGKGSRKRSSARNGKKAELISDDDSINNDACSVASGQSDNRSVIDDVNANDNEVDELAQQEALEDKLREAIDGLTQKCAKSRTTCFNGIEKAFSLKYIPDFVEDRKMTITDGIERALKKGRGDEQSAAARLATLVCAQLGAFDSAEMIVKDLKTVLISTANNKSNSPLARAECYWALSMTQFLSGNDAADTIEIMQLLLTAVFDSTSADLANLQATVLSAWTLLLTLISPSDVHNMLNGVTTDTYMLSLDQLRELLESQHLELRLAAGDALAVIFELGHDYSEDNEPTWTTDLIATLQDLATDSSRHRAKKDRKQQKASFRDILRYIKEGEFPELQIKFGHETLYLEEWCTRIQYTACCRLLGSGLNIHLAENKLLREIFSLGDRVLAPRSAQRRATKQQRAKLMSDDDSINNEACGVASSQSVNRSVMDNVNANDNEVDELAQQEALEDKLREAIDGLTQKCADSRTMCLNGIEKAFSLKYIPDFVEDRKMTITDCIERALKKGRGDEQSAAARLASLVCAQLGAFESAEMIVKALKTVLISTANNKSNSPSARAECYWALSMTQFLSGNDAADTIEIMQLLLTAVFDSTSADLANLQATVLSAWTLLLTLISPSDVHNMLNGVTTDTYMLSLDQLRELLESQHLELRLAAGEALAVIFELGHDYSEDNEPTWTTDLIATLQDLATDSSRHRAKKDRKQQKASFRDILRYIKEGELPELQIKFGHETLYLEEWCTRIQYTACCRLLGSGLNIHLAENKLLRKIFSLGDRVLAPRSAQRRATKQQRNLLNAAAFKARTRQRNKNRDKRSAALAS